MTEQIRVPDALPEEDTNLEFSAEPEIESPPMTRDTPAVGERSK